MNSNPKHSDLYRDGKEGQIRASYALHLHPNPRFYKYYWRVFHDKSPEGKLFFEEKPMNTHDAMELCRALEEQGKGYLLYNYHLPRSGENVPFYFQSDRWTGAEIARPYEDDPDPVWKGHK